MFLSVSLYSDEFPPLLSSFLEPTPEHIPDRSNTELVNLYNEGNRVKLEPTFLAE